MKAGAAGSLMKPRKWIALGLVMLQLGFPLGPMAQTGRPAGENGTEVKTTGASGFVYSISGAVYVRKRDGTEELAKVGDMFGPGATFRTDSDGAVTLLFADGQNIALSAASVLKIEDYRFDPRNLKTNRASFELQSGMMRVVTGAIHTDNPDGLLISAGKAFVDILSPDVTAFVLEVDPKSLTAGSAAVTIGEISIVTPQGFALRLTSDQFSRWQPGADASRPVPIAAAPAAIQAAASESEAKIFASNAPIDIQSAAFAATLSQLPSPGAGPSEPILQAQAPQSSAPIVAPAGTPGGGGGRGCVGSPC